MKTKKKEMTLVKISDNAGGGWLEAWADGKAVATLYVHPDETDHEAITQAIDELNENPLTSWDFTDEKSYKNTLMGIQWMLTQRKDFPKLKSF